MNRFLWVSAFLLVLMSTPTVASAQEFSYKIIEAKTEEIQHQLSELRRERALVDTTMDRLKSTYDANLTALKSARECVAELENEISLAEQGCPEYEKLRDLEKQLQEEIKTQVTLEAHLSQRQAKATTIQDKLTVCVARILLLEQEIATRTDEVEGHEHQLSDLEAEKGMAGADQHLSELDKAEYLEKRELRSSEKWLGDSGKKLREEKRIKAALETELSYLDVGTREYQGKLETCKSRIIRLEDDIAKLKKEVKGHERHLSDLRAEKEKAETKVDELKPTCDACLAELNGAKDRIAELENTISLAEKRLSEYENKLRDLEKEFEKEIKTKKKGGTSV